MLTLAVAFVTGLFTAVVAISGQWASSYTALKVKKHCTKNYLTNERYFGCLSMDRYDKLIGGTGGTLRTALASGECFMLKPGERVFVVNENQPYVGVVQLRREGHPGTFWTSSMAIEIR